jgi:hypothetical protein
MSQVGEFVRWADQAWFPEAEENVFRNLSRSFLHFKYSIVLKSEVFVLV